MHLLNLFSLVERLCHPPIIAPRQLPVQPFHHGTRRVWLFVALFLCSLAHPPLLFSPTLPSSSSSGNPFLMSLSLDQNTSIIQGPGPLIPTNEERELPRWEKEGIIIE